MGERALQQEARIGINGTSPLSLIGTYAEPLTVWGTPRSKHWRNRKAISSRAQYNGRTFTERGYRWGLVDNSQRLRNKGASYMSRIT